MKEIKLTQKNNQLSILLLLCFAFMVSSCTRYAGNINNTTTTTSGGNNTGAGPTPLPPIYTGGGTGAGGTNTGGSVNPNIPLTYIQALFYTGLNGSYITANDSVSLKSDGSYTPLYAGTTLLKYKVGSGATSDVVYTAASYYLRPYSYYTYVVFKSPTSAAGETILWNDITTPAGGTAQVRFVSLDPLTTAVPITFKLTNYLDNVIIPNRTYLDNRTDSNLYSFRTITPGFSNVSFVYRDSSLLTFSQNFESGKKYTVFAGALSYTASSKGTLPINYYQVARHN